MSLHEKMPLMRFEQYNRAAAGLLVRADAVIAIVETDIKSVSRIALSSGYSYEVNGDILTVAERVFEALNEE